MITVGALLFGVVVGWTTYYTLAHSQSVYVKDIGVVIGSIGGAAVLALFPAQSKLFGAYGIGLAFGFFGYWLILFGSPFYAFGWKKGWIWVVDRWTSDARAMAAVEDDDVGPEPLKQNRRRR